MGNRPSGLDCSNPVTDKESEWGHSEEQMLEYGVSGMQGLRPTMEDRHLHSTELPVEGMKTLTDHSIFAVFDGHGGGFSSAWLQENFLNTLKRQPEMEKYALLPKQGPKSRADANGVSLLKQALIASFQELDRNLTLAQREKNEIIMASRNRSNNNSSDEDSTGSDDAAATPEPVTPLILERSGSTCVCLVVTPTHWVCANTGDSRAVLRRYGKALPLSFDHKPSNIPERSRIANAGGEIKGKRIDGDLAVSRAFGDFLFKSDLKRAPELQKVIVTPDVVVYPRDMQGDEFVVLACDGVWDVASNEDCTQFLQTLLSEGETDLRTLCEAALDTCLERNSRDNMTMLMIGLPAMKVETSRSAQMHNALCRTTRLAKTWGNRTGVATKQAWNSIDCNSGSQRVSV